MARQTIIDWQRDSLVVAVGQGQGATVSIEKLSEQKIEAASEESPAGELRNGDVAQALRRAVDELGIGKSDAVIIASRDLVEVRTIAVPRIDPAELPDVIRFQAQRQLANMGDNWALDYVLLPEEPGQEMHTALVGVVSPTALAEIHAACEQAGVQPTHIALRPLEIARYAINSGKLATTEPVMVICISEEHADLLILNQGSVAQVRSTKLPSELDQWPAALRGELRRSLMASSSQLGNKPIARAMLVASGELATQSKQLIIDALDCDVITVDPAQSLPSDLPRRVEIARSAAHRVVGLLGAFNFVSAPTNSKLDFKNPKKRPPPKSKTTTYLLAAAVGALLLLGGTFWWVSTNRDLDDELAMYRDQVASQQELTKVAEARITDLREVESFLEGSPNWLDELAYISERIPPADKVLLGEPAFAVLPDGTGRITLPVAVDSSPTIATLEKSLRDEQHVIAGRNTIQLDAKPDELYRWRVDEAISVVGRGWKLVSQLSTSRSAGQTTATSATQTSAASTPQEPVAETTPEDASAASNSQEPTAPPNQ